MSPVLIDLTSSPEPEESPNKIANSALQNFRPRKQRNGSTSALAVEEEDGDAGTILKQFQARKQNERSNVNDRANEAPLGSFVPPGIERKGTDATPTRVQNNLDEGSRVVTDRPAMRPFLLDQQPKPKVKEKTFNRIQEGSLASLLQEEATGAANHGSPTWPNGTQKKPYHVEPPNSTTRKKRAVQNAESYGPVDSSRVIPSLSPFLRTSNEAMRPFKRRRTDDTKIPSSPSGQTAYNDQSARQGPTKASVALQAGNQVGQVPIRSASPTSATPARTSKIYANQQKVQNVNIASATESSQNASDTRSSLVKASHDLKAEMVSKSGKEHSGSTKQTTRYSSDNPKQSTGSASILNFPDSSTGATGKSGEPYTPGEDALIIKLKEEDGLNWQDIVKHFPNRTWPSLQTRYSNKLKRRPKQAVAEDQPRKTRLSAEPAQEKAIRSPSPDHRARARASRRRIKRNNEASVIDGFVSWADVKKSRLLDDIETTSHAEDSSNEPEANPVFETERAYPKSLLRILRQRELGTSMGRSWVPSARSVPDELKEQVFDKIGPRKYYNGTSGDVTCLAWAPDGKRFAAGSIAITDERSMQYNRPYNLLLGDKERSLLQELPEHHLRRPEVEAGAGNVNGLRSMRESQDPRLFMTVASVQFSPESDILYSASCDAKVRAYEMNDDAPCLYEIQHPAPLDLLSVSNLGRLATASHQSDDGSIRVYAGQELKLSLSPSRAFQETSRAIYPSALRWGAAAHHSSLLLAGFSIDSLDDERDIAGETCLWDVRAEARIPIGRVTRNVFDVAWNPAASSASTVFAVACTRGTEKMKQARSVVQCFAPSQNKATPVIRWDCPAFDINDVIYCQHDDNLIAAGATDGKVYVWDQRFADRNNSPLHILEHGDTLNVLDHDREREIADTGVRFISWGASSSRLYTGSSDGVVKVWNPKRPTENSHVKDLATFTSAIMSGAFSPDNRELLIGEEQGRINLLSVGYEHTAVRSMQRFELQSAVPPSKTRGRSDAARVLLNCREIVTRPMGDLPKQQAVQGPFYEGPFMEPSEDDLLRTQIEYQKALDDQNDAQCQVDMSQSQSDENDQTLLQATRRVQELQETLLGMQNRQDEFKMLEQRAMVHQDKLRQRRQERKALETSHPSETCKLDCNYLPASTDDGEVLDSRRSESRIPGLLRRQPAGETSDMTQEELVEAGMTHKCMSCRGPSRNPKPGQQALCERCRRMRAGLTASCEICSAPIQAVLDSSTLKLCDQCNFSCFRCAQPAYIESGGSYITCDRCELTWEVVVLGYELVRKRGRMFKHDSDEERIMDFMN